LGGVLPTQALLSSQVEGQILMGILFRSSSVPTGDRKAMGLLLCG
jgi:hypothetical protein